MDREALLIEQLVFKRMTLKQTRAESLLHEEPEKVVGTPKISRGSRFAHYKLKGKAGSWL